MHHNTGWCVDTKNAAFWYTWKSSSHHVRKWHHKSKLAATTLQSMMDDNRSQQRIRPCHENGQIKTDSNNNPQPIYEFSTETFKSSSLCQNLCWLSLAFFKVWRALLRSLRFNKRWVRYSTCTCGTRYCTVTLAPDIVPGTVLAPGTLHLVLTPCTRNSVPE